MQIAWGPMVVLISEGLKNKIRSFSLFEKGQCILHPDPYNHTRHKENPQPSPITTSIPGKVNQVVTVLNGTCLSWDVPYLRAAPFRWDILTYLGKNIKANQGQHFSSEPHNTSRTLPFPLYWLLLFPHLQAFRDHTTLFHLSQFPFLITHFPICNAICASCDYNSLASSKHVSGHCSSQLGCKSCPWTNPQAQYLSWDKFFIWSVMVATNSN